MIRSPKALTASSFISMFFIGVGSTIIGAAARNIGLTPYQIGILMAVMNLGFMVAVTASGALADRYDKTRLLFIGSIVLAAAFATFYGRPSFMLNLLIMFFIGAGTGVYEGVTDAMLLDIHSERESLFININHFFVTFGSLMITLYLVFLQMNWRRSTVQSGIVVAVLAVFFAFTRLRGRDAGMKLSESLGVLMKERIVAVLFGAVICSVGLELGVVGIMTTYLMESGFNQITSKLVLIIFLSGIATGRVLIGFFSKNRQIPHFILLLFGSALIFIGVFFFTSLHGYTYVLVYFMGMTVSALLPLIITLAGLLYPEHAGTVLGIIKLAIPVGGMLIPFLFSLLTKAVSFRTSLVIFPLSALAGFILLLTNRRRFDHFIKNS